MKGEDELDKGETWKSREEKCLGPFPLKSQEEKYVESFPLTFPR